MHTTDPSTDCQHHYIHSMDVDNMYQK